MAEQLRFTTLLKIAIPLAITALVLFLVTHDSLHGPPEVLLAASNYGTSNGDSASGGSSSNLTTPEDDLTLKSVEQAENIDRTVSTAAINWTAFFKDNSDEAAMPLPPAGCMAPPKPEGGRTAKVRPRPLLHVHLSHGGGAFTASVARQNGERMFGGGFATCKGDLPREHTIVRTCLERALEVQRFGITFQQMERGFETGEFCPTVYDYVLFLRDPMKRMNSHLSKWLKRPERMDPLLLLLQRTGAPLDTGPMSEWHKMLHVPGEKSLRRGHGVMNFDNLLTRWLTGDSRWLHAPIGTVNETAFRIAADNLARFKVAVPLTEMESAAHIIDWEYAEKDKYKHNVHHHTKGKLTSVQMETLQRLNKWDYKLWECVRERKAGFGCPGI